MIIIIHRGCFIFQVLAYCLAKTRVGDPVRGKSPGRHETAGNLVLTLGAGFEACEPMLDAVLDAGVITDFKMQAVVILITTPVPSIQGVIAFKTDRSRDDPVFVTGKHGPQTLRHGLEELE